MSRLVSTIAKLQLDVLHDRPTKAYLVSTNTELDYYNTILHTTAYFVGFRFWFHLIFLFVGRYLVLSFKRWATRRSGASNYFFYYSFFKTSPFEKKKRTSQCFRFLQKKSTLPRQNRDARGLDQGLMCHVKAWRTK